MFKLKDEFTDIGKYLYLPEFNIKEYQRQALLRLRLTQLS
jgi:hypothetical protein